MTYIYGHPQPQQIITQPQQRVFTRQPQYAPNFYYQATPQPPQYQQQAFIMQPSGQQFQMMQFAPQAGTSQMFFPAEEMYAMPTQMAMAIPQQAPAQAAQPVLRYAQVQQIQPVQPQTKQTVQQPQIEKKKKKDLHASSPVQQNTITPPKAQAKIFSQQSKPSQKRNTIYAQNSAALPIQTNTNQQDFEPIPQSLENCLPKAPAKFPIAEFSSPPGCFNIIKRGNLPGLSFSQISI